MTDHVSVTPVTIGTHRLWISLWTPLGWPADNAGGPGGNGEENSLGAAGVHSPSPARRHSRTGLVATGTGRRLGYRPLSPGSTVPTTTTFCLISQVQNPIEGTQRHTCGPAPEPARPGAARRLAAARRSVLK